MEFKKSDWTLVREAEAEGLMVAMTNLVERKRTDLNNELSDYFRKEMPNYTGSFDEFEGEDILHFINNYLEENDISKHLLDFPFFSGTDINLIPITENLQLKVVVADEYHGSGDYAKYVMVDFFMINENTTKQDVDILIDFVKNHLS